MPPAGKAHHSGSNLGWCWHARLSRFDAARVHHYHCMWRDEIWPCICYDDTTMTRYTTRTTFWSDKYMRPWGKQHFNRISFVSRVAFYSVLLLYHLSTTNCLCPCLLVFLLTTLFISITVRRSLHEQFASIHTHPDMFCSVASSAK